MRYLVAMLLVATMAMAGTVRPELRDAMVEVGEGELLRVLVKPVGRTDINYIMQATEGMGRDGRREFAAEVMKERAEASQAGIIEQLEAMPEGFAEDVHPFWIVNAVAVSMTPEAIEQIAGREDVLYVRLMRPADILIEPVEVGQVEVGGQTDANAWGVDKIDAPDVWAMGYEGEGIIVSVVDTGVNYNHLDLHNNMWHDTDAGYHYGWDFDDNDGDPMDTYGHGTHCAGSVASDGTAGTVCGVAPAATIMALRVGVSFSDEQDVWDAFQFSIDHDADVISTSLGWPQSQSPDRQEWREVEENILAAGICHSIAAGNEGGSTGQPYDLRTPGDCPPPWHHPDQSTSGGLSACVSVGATDSSDNIAYFSSRGYSTWETDYPWYDYPDTSPEIGLIDPDISAPGVDVLSCSYNNISGYQTMSGTSMATPHIAGCMALLLDANYNLTPAQVDSLLEMTALELGSSGKDNVYGAGRVQIYEAVLDALNVGVDESASGVPAPGIIISATGGNPVRGALTFDLYTGSAGSVEIALYDISGHMVTTLHDGALAQGSHSFAMELPSEVGSGLYFLRAASPRGESTTRFTLLR